MTKTYRRFLLIACISTVGPGLGQLAFPSAAIQTSQQTEAEQVGPREATFKEASEAFEKARDLRAELLSPRYLSQARQSYQKAMEIYDRGGKLADVRANLSKCMQNLELATKAAEIGQVALKDLLAVREETLATGFSFDRSSDFREAEKKLGQAAQKVEKGDLKGAQKPGRESAQRYRRAVLQILEKQVIPDARRKLKNLEGSYTKEDYKRAENALKDLERKIKSQRNVVFSIAEFHAELKDSIEQALTPRPPTARDVSGGE